MGPADDEEMMLAAETIAGMIEVHAAEEDIDVAEDKTNVAAADS